MINLIKLQKVTGEPLLISKDGEIEIQDCGVMLKFPSGDNRKPSHAVLIAENEVEALTNKLLDFLIRKGEQV